MNEDLQLIYQSYEALHSENNESIAHATQVLQTFFDNPNSITLFLSIISNSTNNFFQQEALINLKTIFSLYFQQYPPEIIKLIQNTLFSFFSSNTNQNIIPNITHLLAYIYSKTYDFQIFQLFLQLLQSPDASQLLSGLFLWIELSNFLITPLKDRKSVV